MINRLEKMLTGGDLRSLEKALYCVRNQKPERV